MFYGPLACYERKQSTFCFQFADGITNLTIRTDFGCVKSAFAGLLKEGRKIIA